MIKILKLWIKLCGLNRCYMCRTKFENGIVKKHPKQFFRLNSFNWFTGEFLAHLKTTHGLDPEIITEFLIKIRDDKTQEKRP